MTRADPPSSDEKAEKDATRDKRRAQALRANLKRRKAQLRGRAAAEADVPERPVKSP